MKITKWFLLVALAFLCCACSKNDPLAYVSKDAEWVVYGNLEEVLNHKLWGEFEKNARNFRDFRHFTKGLKNILDATPEECEARFAFWGRFSKRGHLKDVTGVIVLKDLNADDIIERMIDYWEEERKGEVDKITVDDCPAYVFAKTYRYYYGEEETSIRFSIAKLDDKIIQVFLSDSEPDTIATPDKKSELAKQIDDDCIAGMAVSGDVIRNLPIEDLYGLDIPAIGDMVVMLFADDDQIKVEATIDISDID